MSVEIFWRIDSWPFVQAGAEIEQVFEKVIRPVLQNGDRQALKSGCRHDLWNPALRVQGFAHSPCPQSLVVKGPTTGTQKTTQKKAAAEMPLQLSASRFAGLGGCKHRLSGDL